MTYQEPTKSPLTTPDLVPKYSLDAGVAKQVVAAASTKIVGDAVALCLGEAGVEGYAVPTDGSPRVANFPSAYRLMDGAYTDNSGLAGALAQLQCECEHKSDELDCAESTRPLLVIIDNDGLPNEQGTPDPAGSSALLFRSPNGVKPGEVFTRTNGITTGYIGIFDRPFPDSTEFETYGTTSKVWFGNATTASNAMYAVRGGMKVLSQYS